MGGMSVEYIPPKMYFCYGYVMNWIDLWHLFTYIHQLYFTGTGTNIWMILVFYPTNERQRYFVMMSLIGWVQS